MPDHPLQERAIGDGIVAWREAGTGPPLVLLHGIGSGSASWQAQLDQLSRRFRVLAWDAPGYGGSSPLARQEPLASDYAAVVHAWLAALGVSEPVVVGHSLGAIVAAAWAARADAHARGLLLASPARGYGKAAPEVRSAKYRERIELVERLGIEGLARERSAGLCAPGAPQATVARVAAVMARATAGGYAQAAYMLAHDDLATHLRGAPRPLAVLCGEFDRVTPPAGCAEVAADCSCPFVTLPGVAHACYVEDGEGFNRALCAALDAAEGTA
ncbi:MAG: alpha/beta hydrolase [Burkholderiales bacterium]|nr:alpha/beta hydrolase [Burkholderiales bacterium]